jgi:predicted murein hydrolase (TIGR00659 family)
MNDLLQTLWTPLRLTPLLWLFATLAAYALGGVIQKRLWNSPLANPVLIAIILLVALLLLSRSSYSAYFAGAQFIHFLLGPATVALAVPLAVNLHHVRRSLAGISVALLAGSVTAICSGAVIVWLLGGSRELALSMAPKAATTPIAMSISEQIGGVPTLTAAMAIAGGILAAICGQALLRLLRVNDWRAQGLAAGVSGSGIAAANVARLNGLAAAFAALGIGLNGLLTALCVPALMSLWPH